MTKILITFLVVLGLLVAKAPTGGTQSLTLPSGYPSGGDKQNPVEQQSDWPWFPGPTDCSSDVRCVVNPLPCAWDVDDHWLVLEGNRALTGTVSGTVCFVSDATSVYRSVCDSQGNNCNTNWWSTHHGRLGFQLIAPSDKLVITISYAQQNRVFTLGAAPANNLCNGCFKYEFCGHAVYDTGDPALVSIPNSAGGPNNENGVGIRSDVTIKVTNPTPREIKKISLDLRSVGVLDTGASCTYDLTLNQIDYPFEWTQT